MLVMLRNDDGKRAKDAGTKNVSAQTAPLHVPSGEDLNLPTPQYPGCDFYPSDFVNILETAIQTAIKEHSAGGLMLVTISNLSMIINAYGHDTSEIVVHDLLKKIQSLVGNTDVVQRLQRDQIGIVLT